MMMMMVIMTMMMMMRLIKIHQGEINIPMVLGGALSKEIHVRILE